MVQDLLEIVKETIALKLDERGTTSRKEVFSEITGRGYDVTRIKEALNGVERSTPWLITGQTTGRTIYSKKTK